MDGEMIYAGIFIAVLIYWMWRANHTKKRDLPVAPSSSEQLGNKKSSGDQRDDPFLQELAREKVEVERNAQAEAETYTKLTQARVEADEQLKQRLKKFADDNGLTRMLPDLYEEMRNYPAWSKRDDWATWNTLGLEGVVEEVSDGVDKRDIHFNFEGTRYTIATRNWSGFESTTYTDFTLREGDEEMFCVTAEVEYDMFRYYHPRDVKAFVRRGKWASMLVNLHARKELAQPSLAPTDEHEKPRRFANAFQTRSGSQECARQLRRTPHVCKPDVVDSVVFINPATTEDLYESTT